MTNIPHILLMWSWPYSQWETPSNTTFQVWRSSSPTSRFELVGETQATQFVVRPVVGQGYYKVAVKAKGDL